jgi:glycosyltransferase involved in cell wall biosynthesis
MRAQLRAAGDHNGLQKPGSLDRVHQFIAAPPRAPIKFIAARIHGMRVLYHHRTASRDGQAVHIDEIVSSLRSQGHDVCVVGPASGAGASMGDDVGWVQRIRAVLPKALYELLELGYTVLAYWRLSRAAKAFKPDFIYERYNLYLLAGALLQRRTGLPLLLEVNAPLADERERFGGLKLPRLARWAERTAWRSATYVLPVTRVLAQHVVAAGVAPQRIVVIPNGINRSHFAMAPSPDVAKATIGWPGSLILGFTGFVRDWHGVDRVVRWLADPATPTDARLLVVGDGPARAELESLAQSLHLRERVRFTGVVPREQVPGYVAAFDVALQPAVVAYASPLKLFEYLALGKAVVAPRQPNIEEVLTDGTNALLFDANEAGALEAALGRMCADSTLRARLAAGAHATIDNLSLTWDHNARRIVGLACAAAATPRA